MENSAPLLSGDLNNNICQECGLPLRIYSYERINPNTDLEKIKLKLYCQNLEHKKINEIDFENYQDFIDEYLNKMCKCVLCNKIIQNTNETFYYCYTCHKIICDECLNNKHEKEHKNVFKYEDINNKCLKHFDDKNDIIYYCNICRINLCQNCILEDFEHIKKHNVKEIKVLKENNNNNHNIINIKKQQDNNKRERELLLEKLKKVNTRISFNEFLLKEQNNYFHLFDDNNNINNNNINNIPPPIQNDHQLMNKNIVNINAIDNYVDNNLNNNELNSINILYHDENIKYEGMDIINDCLKIQNDTKGSLILCNDLINLDLILKNFVNKKIKSKFVLIANGSSSENVIKFIKKNNYKSLFIGACIYTANLNKYSKIKENNKDFIDIICIDPDSLIIFIKNCFEKIKVENERFYINLLINFYTYKTEYNALHRELSNFYGDESEKTFSLNYSIIQDFINKGEYSNEIKKSFLDCCKNFSELSKKNYVNIIMHYLKDDNFSKTLNLLLMKKDLSVNIKIGYFAGNLMHCLVEYGRKMKKGVNSKTTFYKGLNLNIIDLLEFLKNRNLNITFPYFLSITTKKDLAKISSKIDKSNKEKKEKDLYSVFMKIDYLYDKGYEPCIFELNDIVPYPDEEEYILLPFTFLRINKIKIDSNQFTADIELTVIGKKEILEYKIKQSHKMEYDSKNKIMIAK